MRDAAGRYRRVLIFTFLNNLNASDARLPQIADMHISNEIFNIASPCCPLNGSHVVRVRGLRSFPCSYKYQAL